MRIVLLAKNKLGFVYGDCGRDDFHVSLRSQWDRCNAIVLFWILNIVNTELLVGLDFASSATLVWQDLKERFSKIDGSQIFSSIGDSSDSAYLTWLKLLWDEYDVLVPISSCNCANSQQNLQHVLQYRLFQFLMGLNETYSTIRSQILLMQSLPSVNQVYSMIVQEESQRSYLSGISPISDFTSMFSNSSSASVARRGQFNGTCDYCKPKGHKRKQCYCLIGFPPDFKFTKRKNVQAVMMVNSNTPDSSPPDLGSLNSPMPAPVFTTEQYNQILGILNKGPTTKSTTDLTGSLHWKGDADW
ncbi:UBN2_3 domain-containing protein [Gossypium australe]|uniref:UBN2_3 domain-containing protein n=1 Tax=Gossypium australe TaxID=47621 RepID=A0A5B6WM20_9ROSI|nr:UBN2_3 domain-containing protein [Gossypium australe]